MSKNDIGWIDKNKVSDAVHTLKERQRSRRRRRGPSPKESGDESQYVDLFGETQRSPLHQAEAPQEDGFIPSPSAPPTRAHSAPQKPPAPAPTSTGHAETQRTTTPTEKIISSPSILDEADAPEPTIPGARPTASRKATAPVQSRLTATLETTPTTAQEPDQEPDLNFQDALDVLRSGDPSHPQERPAEDRLPTADLPMPTLRGEDDDALRLTDTIETEQLSPQEAMADLQLQMTDEEHSAPTQDDDAPLTLKDTSLPQESARPQLDDEDDALSLPAHDLDLSLRTNRSLTITEDHSDTRDLSDDLVFESDDFQDEESADQEEIALPDVNVDTDDAPQEDGDVALPLSASALEDLARGEADAPAPGRKTPAAPEHPYVPQIHSQILRTVRLKNAPNPEDSETVHAWFQALYDWIQNAEAPATQFFVADQAGLPLLHTGVDEHTTAVAVATRKSMSDLQKHNVQTGSGYTVFRHNDDRYMNLIWAPSQHGIITLGMISDHVYPDERLASFEGRLLRAIERLPFA